MFRGGVEQSTHEISICESTQKHTLTHWIWRKKCTVFLFSLFSFASFISIRCAVSEWAEDAIYKVLYTTQHTLNAGHDALQVATMYNFHFSSFFLSFIDGRTEHTLWCSIIKFIQQMEAAHVSNVKINTERIDSFVFLWCGEIAMFCINIFNTFSIAVHLCII